MTQSRPAGLIEAVMQEDEARVRQLVAAGANLEDQDGDEQTPLLIAAKTDQFIIAEFLLDAGASIWAKSDFGWTVGFAAQSSNLARGAENEARLRVLAKLKARGFPFPAEHPTLIEAKAAKGEWPPR
jgi:ankyrin repeat protein